MTTTKEYYQHEGLLFESLEDLRKYYEQEGWEMGWFQDEDLDNYLAENYTYAEVFSFTEEEHDEILNKIRNLAFKNWVHYKVVTLEVWRP